MPPLYTTLEKIGILIPSPFFRWFFFRDCRNIKSNPWNFDFEKNHGLLTCHGLLFQKMPRVTQNFTGYLFQNCYGLQKSARGYFTTFFS